MARRNLSDLLQSRFVCSVPWESMAGDGARRFCSQCRCEVFDLEQMEPRAIKARLEAKGGRLCARTVRENGRIRMASPPSPEPRPQRGAERAPTMAAGVLGTWLALAAPAAASPPSPPLALISTTVPIPQDDPGATAAPSSVQPAREQESPEAYVENIDVTANLEAYDQRGTVGIVVSSTLSLRELFDESELVFTAKVGSSRVLSVTDGIAEIHTTLRLARRFKGEGWDRDLTYRHSLPAEAFDPGIVEHLPELDPGTLVLVFASRVEGELDLTTHPIYEATGYSDGLRELTPEKALAYTELLVDLADLRRRAGAENELEPAGLMEWLVATLENPFTRQEQVGSEVRWALQRFDDLARDPQVSEEDAALGASFTEAHRMRLSSALLATTTLNSGDRDLYQLVVELDPDTAKSWLVDSLRRRAIPENSDVYWWLNEIAETIDAERAESFLGNAAERLETLDDLYPEEATSANQKAWEEEHRALAEALVAELAALYEPDF